MEKLIIPKKLPKGEDGTIIENPHPLGCGLVLSCEFLFFKLVFHKLRDVKKRFLETATALVRVGAGILCTACTIVK